MVAAPACVLTSLWLASMASLRGSLFWLNLVALLYGRTFWSCLLVVLSGHSFSSYLFRYVKLGVCLYLDVLILLAGSPHAL